jgi:hypothetical protein
VRPKHINYEPSTLAQGLREAPKPAREYHQPVEGKLGCQTIRSWIASGHSFMSATRLAIRSSRSQSSKERSQGLREAPKPAREYHQPVEGKLGRYQTSRTEDDYTHVLVLADAVDVERHLAVALVGGGLHARSRRVDRQSARTSTSTTSRAPSLRACARRPSPRASTTSRSRASLVAAELALDRLVVLARGLGRLAQALSEGARLVVRTEDDYTQAGVRYRSFEDWERDDLIANLVADMKVAAELALDRLVVLARGLGRLAQALSEGARLVVDATTPRPACGTAPSRIGSATT